MKFEPLEIEDVVLITPRVFGDRRGFFMETWQEREFVQAGIDVHFVQDNHSMSLKGILRGLHYQIEQAQGKLVRVISGCVFDVAVDLRRGSSSFGRWAGRMLSAENRQMLWIPPGFAHGFYVMSAQAEFLYKCTDYWAPRHERCIRWDDPEIAVEWPIPPGTTPVLSEKDSAGVFFRHAECYS